MPDGSITIHTTHVESSIAIDVSHHFGDVDVF